MRPVSPQADLGDSLLSWRNPSLLAPLGHLVSADAPSGVIHRLIEPSAPPATSPVGSPLTFAAAAPRRPKGSVVQRMLAPITSWASRESEPADTEPDRGDGTRTSPDPAPLPGEVLLATPAPVQLPSVGVPAPVQRFGPASATPTPLTRAPLTRAPLTRAPAPELPILELPVLHAETQVARAAEPDSGAVPPTTDPAWSAEPTWADDGPAGGVEDRGGEVPTLGIDPPSSATQPADGGTGGPADVTGQERRAIAPVVETRGRPAPVNPTVQRAVTAEAPTPPTPEPVTPLTPEPTTSLTPEPVSSQPRADTSGMDEVPTLGMDPSPAAVQPVAGDLGEPSDVPGPELGGGGSGIETAERLMPLAPTVQRAESGTTAASGNGEGAEVPTLGVRLPPVTPMPHDVPLTDPPGRRITDPPVQRMTDPPVQRMTDPPVQRAAETGPAAPLVPNRPGAARRLGLGPPLALDAVTVQLNQATPITTPPPALPISSPPGPADPVVVQPTGTAEEPPGLVGEVIAPLLGESSTPLPSVATVIDPAVIDPTGIDPTGSDSAARTSTPAAIDEPTVPAVRSPSPPPVSLPVLRVRESATPVTEAPAPPPSAAPVVARLIGDRTPPLLTVTVPGSDRTEPGARAQHGAPVQRAHSAPGAQPTGPGGPHLPAQPPGAAPLGPAPLGPAPLGFAPLSPAGYPAAAAAPLPVQLDSTPMRHTPGPVRQPAPLVVQTALARPPEPVSTELVALQAQEIALEPGVDLPGEPVPPDQPLPAAPAGSPPPGAPTAGASAAGASAAGAPAAGAASGSPDELVKKLFEPLLRRLKTELRLDRERRGMLTDLHH